MLQNIKKNHQSGFTIIEVLIVLAIAGLILVAVLNAVPALNRSSRNTQRKTDANAVLAAFSDYTSNNNGAIPSTLVSSNGVVTFGAGTTATAKVGYFTTGFTSGTTVAPFAGMVTLLAANTATLLNTFVDSTHDYAQVTFGTVCNTNGDNSSVAGPARSVTVIYASEGNSSTYKQVCVGS